VSNESEKTYEVGYKKPPVETRFKKGKSPFPSGRPKKAPALRDPGAILEAIDNEQIAITEKGKRKWMRKAEIQHRVLFAKAIKGDLKAARLLFNMATQYFAPEERENSQPIFISDTQAEQRFGKDWHRRITKHNALVLGE
jgi:Family of unknown function (DUF5681)